MNQPVQQFAHAKPGLGTHLRGVGGIYPNHVFDFLRDANRIGGGQVDFVQHRDDHETLVDGLVAVGDGLCFNALGSIHDEQRTFTGGE